MKQKVIDYMMQIDKILDAPEACRDCLIFQLCQAIPQPNNKSGLIWFCILNGFQK